MNTIMNIGKRIRSIRMHRKLTQKELGGLLGYSNSPSIRIAQYESGQRTPQKEAIQKFSKALNVSTKAIDIAAIDDMDALMHILFSLEEFFNMRIGLSDDEIYLVFKNEEVQKLLSEWLKKYESFKNGDISEYEYKEWQYQYCNRK